MLKAYDCHFREVVLCEGRIVSVRKVRVHVETNDEEQQHANDVHDYEER